MKAAILCIGVLLSVGACKKSGGGGGGGGGGPGWMVGTSGLMVRVQTDGTASNYELASTENLNAIACRYVGEAWVVGDHGALLYTSDAGVTWQPKSLPTSAHLRALATQDFGPVFVAGDGVFLTSTDTGRTWRSILGGDDTVSFRSLAAAQDAETVLAVSEDGAVWSYQDQQLVKLATLPGARVVAVSPDGQTAVLAGENLLARSSDAGRTWTQLTGGDKVRYDGLQIDSSGQATAVGALGTIAHISASGNVVMQHVGTADLHTVHIAENGDDYESVGYTAGDGGQVYMTHDGGWTWSAGPNVGGTVLASDMIGEFHN
jgi:photosystem II stability/assembly factor-like uncharacterized protein